jgi:hypothetical protein
MIGLTEAMVINPALTTAHQPANNVCRVVPFLFSALAIYGRCAKVIAIQIVLFVMYGTAGADSRN